MTQKEETKTMYIKILDQNPTLFSLLEEASQHNKEDIVLAVKMLRELKKEHLIV